MDNKTDRESKRAILIENEPPNPLGLFPHLKFNQKSK